MDRLENACVAANHVGAAATQRQAAIAWGAIQTVADSASARIKFVAFRNRLFARSGRIRRLLGWLRGRDRSEPQAGYRPSKGGQKHPHFIPQSLAAFCYCGPAALPDRRAKIRT